MGKKTYWLYFTLPLFFLFLTACHSEYAVLNYSIHHKPCYNQDSSEIAVFVSTFGYLPPKGLARFPDGGQSKMLHENVSLFLLSNDNSELEIIEEFSDLTDLIGAYRSSWKTKVCYHGDSLIFQVEPVSDYNFIMSYAAKNRADSLQIEQLQKKYNTAWLHLPGSRTNRPITAPANCFKGKLTASFDTVTNALEKFPLDALGLNLSEIHPKSKKHYIKGLETGKINSDLTKRAIQEQLMGE